MRQWSKMMNDKDTSVTSAEEAKPMMASESLDTSDITQAAATSSQPGIQSSMKQEIPATDINVEEEKYVVEVSDDDDDDSDKVLNKLRTKESRVSYLMGHIQEIVGCEHCAAVSVQHNDTLMENIMKLEEYAARALLKMKRMEAALVKQEMKPGDDAPPPVKEETKYQEDVLVEKEIKCEERAAVNEELE